MFLKQAAGVESACLLAGSVYGFIPGKLPPCLTKRKKAFGDSFLHSCLSGKMTDREAWGCSEAELVVSDSKKFLATRIVS